MKHDCKSNLGHYLTYVLIMGTFNLAGCDGGASIDEQVTVINPASLECTVKTGDGSEYFRCTSSDKGFMITRGNELLLRITAEEKEFIAYNANAAIAGRVELSPEGFNLQGSNKVKLFEFNRQADGDWWVRHREIHAAEQLPGALRSRAAHGTLETARYGDPRGRRPLRPRAAAAARHGAHLRHQEENGHSDDLHHSNFLQASPKAFHHFVLIEPSQVFFPYELV